MNPEYQPQSRVKEHLFLNLWNEKQWATNTNVLYKGVQDPTFNNIFLGTSLWFRNTSLSSSIPVYGFTLGQSHNDILKQCSDWGVKPGTEGCEYLFYAYNTTMANDQEIVARNPNSQLYVCWNCTTGGNGFVINQNSNIPWFADTLMGAVGHLTV